MREGLYKVEFHTHLGSGSGVAALYGGVIGGGDRGLCYSGAYSFVDDLFSAEVDIEPHADAADIRTVFGVAKARVSLKGRVVGDQGLLTGTTPAAPGVIFEAHLSKLPE